MLLVEKCLVFVDISVLRATTFFLNGVCRLLYVQYSRAQKRGPILIKLAVVRERILAIYLGLYIFVFIQ